MNLKVNHENFIFLSQWRVEPSRESNAKALKSTKPQHQRLIRIEKNELRREPKLRTAEEQHLQEHLQVVILIAQEYVLTATMNTTALNESRVLHPALSHEYLMVPE